MSCQGTCDLRKWDLCHCPWEHAIVSKLPPEHLEGFLQQEKERSCMLGTCLA